MREKARGVRCVVFYSPLLTSDYLYRRFRIQRLDLLGRILDEIGHQCLELRCVPVFAVRPELLDPGILNIVADLVQCLVPIT